jgi:hypothetical protein
MRIDVSDPKTYVGKRWRATVDGTPILTCTMADEEAGVVEYVSMRRNGSAIIGYHDDVIRVTVRGDVRITDL